jgi:hypothetical protein
MFQIFPKVILSIVLLAVSPASSQTNTQHGLNTAPAQASENASKEDHSYLPPSMRDQINRRAAAAGSPDNKLPSRAIGRRYKNKSAHRRLKRDRRYAQSGNIFNSFGE